MLGKKLKYLFFPPSCICCRELLDREDREVDSAFCPECKRKWSRRETPEYLTGIGKDGVPQSLGRGGCFDFVTLAKYRPSAASAVEKFIHRMKRKCPARAINFVSARLARAIESVGGMPTDKNDIIIAYVPRKYSAICKTGTDQAKKLAEGLSVATGYACHTLIKRTGLLSKSQKTLRAHERFDNARGLFVACEDAASVCEGKTVILVDDLLTTGATLGACSAILYRAGATRVVAVTVAMSK